MGLGVNRIAPSISIKIGFGFNPFEILKRGAPELKWMYTSADTARDVSSIAAAATASATQVVFRSRYSFAKRIDSIDVLPLCPQMGGTNSTTNKPSAATTSSSLSPPPRGNATTSTTPAAVTASPPQEATEPSAGDSSKGGTGDGDDGVRRDAPASSTSEMHSYHYDASKVFRSKDSKEAAMPTVEVRHRAKYTFTSLFWGGEFYCSGSKNTD